MMLSLKPLASKSYPYKTLTYPVLTCQLKCQWRITYKLTDLLEVHPNVPIKFIYYDKKRR